MDCHCSLQSHRERLHNNKDINYRDCPGGEMPYNNKDLINPKMERYSKP